MNLRHLLVTRGIYGLILRWGPKRLKAASFDVKYRSGAWQFPPDDQLASVVRRYLREGDLLLMGCGGAAILASLKPTEVSSVVGVDLSAAAVALAGRFASERISFHVGDMVTFETSTHYDVILFSESLYYLPLRQQAALLQRIGRQLKPGGVFVVTVCDATGSYLALLNQIRQRWPVVEDRAFDGSRRHVIVFRP